MFLKTVGNFVGDVAVGTVGVAGSVVGGAVCTTGGLISGTCKGDPLGGLQRGFNDGVTHGGTAGRAVGGATLGAVGVVGKGVMVAADTTVGAGQLAINTVNRTVESSCRGGFLGCSVSDVARLSAFLAADVYSVSDRGSSKWTSRQLEINSCTVAVSLKQWCPQHNLRAAVYQVTSVTGSSDGTVRTGDLILSFKGTDLEKETMSDSIDDFMIALGLFNTAKTVGKKAGLGDDIFQCPRALKEKFGSSRLYVTGHSLGGAAATIYSSHLDNYPHVCQANVFNPGTGFTQNDCDAGNVGDWLREFPISRGIFRLAAFSVSEATIHVHHIWGDGISALTTGSDIMSVTTYSRHSSIPSAHKITNFTSGQMDTLVNDKS